MLDHRIRGLYHFFPEMTHASFFLEHLRTSKNTRSQRGEYHRCLRIFLPGKNVFSYVTLTVLLPVYVGPMGYFRDTFPMNTNPAPKEYDIFSTQSVSPAQGTTVRGVRQDKRVLPFDRVASTQPASRKKDTRSRDMSTPECRSQNRPSDRLVPLTLQVRFAVKAEVQRLAESMSSKTEHISVSKVGGTLLEDAIRKDIHRQHEALLYPIIRQIIREELRAFGNRIVFFLMRIAFAAEQSRILITNILDRMLRRDGVPTETFTKLLDQSNRMARRNIIQKSPQIASLLEEWEASFKDRAEEGTHGQGSRDKGK